jgi:5-oxoprolinase (ATP-hydrolysing) subunit A
MKIDLNCDLGEAVGNDEAIMPYITSANIACGFHAGDVNIMRVTVKLAKQYEVHVGAHPGWQDRENFGRVEMNISAKETEELVLFQINTLAEIAESEGVVLTHVKPHGALYNQAAKDMNLAYAIVHAIKRLGRGKVSSPALTGLAGSKLCEAGESAGLKVIREGFPDRSYNKDGSLMPRSQKGAVIEDPHEVAANAFRLVKAGLVDTLCLHGDHPQAVENAKLVRHVLLENKITLQGLK